MVDDNEGCLLVAYCPRNMLVRPMDMSMPMMIVKKKKKKKKEEDVNDEDTERFVITL